MKNTYEYARWWYLFGTTIWTSCGEVKIRWARGRLYCTANKWRKNVFFGKPNKPFLWACVLFSSLFQLTLERKPTLAACAYIMVLLGSSFVSTLLFLPLPGILIKGMCETVLVFDVVACLWGKNSRGGCENPWCFPPTAFFDSEVVTFWHLVFFWSSIFLSYTTIVYHRKISTYDQSWVAVLAG